MPRIAQDGAPSPDLPKKGPGSPWIENGWQELRQNVPSMSGGSKERAVRSAYYAGALEVVKALCIAKDGGILPMLEVLHELHVEAVAFMDSLRREQERTCVKEAGESPVLPGLRNPSPEPPGA